MASEKNEVAVAEAVQVDIRSLIYVVRNQQVMLDSDLAMLYQVETKALNRSVKRNINRFPKDFMFQLSEDEYQTLRCQIGTSKAGTESNTEGRGGRRYLPYVFTEQGISMLASVLHSDAAVNVSIGIMRAFVEMRHFITNNAIMFERISAVELRQLQYQEQTDAKLEQIFEKIAYHIGASLKDAEKKCFAVSLLQDAGVVQDILQRLELETEE